LALFLIAGCNNPAGGSPEIPPDVTPPAISSAVIENADPRTLTVTFSEAVKITSASGFSISNLAAGATSLSYHSGDNTTDVTFTLNNAAAEGETITLSYSSGTVTDIAGNALAAFNAQPVINKVADISSMSPVLVSATITAAPANQIVAVFSKSVILTDATGFTVSGLSAGETTLTSTSTSENGSAVIYFTMSNDAASTDIITLSYDDTSGAVKDSDDNSLASFSESVVNNVGGSTDNIPPAFVSASVENGYRDRLVVTFNEPVIAANAAGFSMTGLSADLTYLSGNGTTALTFTMSAPAVYGNTITLSYDDDTGTVTDKAGNALAEFGPQPVTNNVAQDKTPTPAVSQATAAKTAATQALVTFTLTNHTDLTGSTWKVYPSADAVDVVSGVTASNNEATLTLTHASDIPTGAYYLSATQSGEAESDRLALTVAAYTLPPPGGGTSVTLTGMLINTTGNVMVRLIPFDSYDEIPVAVGEGTILNGSLTVDMFNYSGNLGDPVGEDPWTDDGGDYWILFLYGPGYSFAGWWNDDDPVDLSGDYIDASGFEIGGPLDPANPDGSISGTISITNFPADVDVVWMYIVAMQYGDETSNGWRSWDSTIALEKIKNNELTNYHFTIPLYEGNDNTREKGGPFIGEEDTRLYIHIEYADGTSWGFDVATVTVANHDDDTELGTLEEVAIEDTVAVGGTVTIILPEDKMLWDGDVGLMLSSNNYPGLWSSFFPPENTWKIRAPSGKTGSFLIDVWDTEDTRYAKKEGTWDGSTTDVENVELTVTFTAEDAVDY
jgi:hypothetical protein